MKLTSAAFLKQYDNINKNEGVRRARSVNFPKNEVYSKNMKDDLLHGVHRNNIIPGTSTHLKRTHIHDIGVELSKRGKLDKIKWTRTSNTTKITR